MKTNHVTLSLILPLFLLGRERRETCVTLSDIQHVSAHRYSSSAGPQFCLMFSRLCRKYLTNWLDILWNHSTDLMPLVKICNP